MSFEDRLGAVASAVGVRLESALADYGDLDVAQAMRWATKGGKRLRGFLVIEGAILHDVPERHAIEVAAAIEAVHAYSLVHDDLPCMDDDALRRGQPTVHIRWDEATAVLAGDALQTLAFELLTDPACHPDGAVRADLALSLARAAGAGGMVRGQALDIAAERADTPLTLEGTRALQAGKTGALIGWAAEAGPRLAASDIGPLSDYARALGLAFQIADDVLDIEGDAAVAGKAVGKDAAAGKSTFVAHLGLDGAKAEADRLVQEACDALAPYGDRADVLRDCAAYVVARDR
ncbi:farnesyl diphosphate synthase [Tranquillimonas rosea]|uniref:Geranylgeranyl diphosphate synthase n=1 Tax=Tranquillimonas rosea TaxID=641238 RepID=A0A1H9UKJ2_9RHOB|nr:farnesyl diphosphate synthase [Tranquillimonas rosea]